MKILVYGAGAIGSVFGAFLSNAQEEVILFGREKQMSAIKDEGLFIEGIWGNKHVKPIKTYFNNIYLNEDHRGTFDLILLTVKSFDTVSAMADIRNILSPNTYVLSLQNGIGNAETIAKVAGKDMTLIFKASYHKKTILDGLKIVGSLAK